MRVCVWFLVTSADALRASAPPAHTRRIARRPLCSLAASARTESPQRKAYSRDFLDFARLRVQLKTPDGKLCRADIPNRRTLLVKMAAEIKTLENRVNGANDKPGLTVSQAAAASVAATARKEQVAAAVAAAKAGAANAAAGGKPEKKEKKKKRRR